MSNGFFVKFSSSKGSVKLGISAALALVLASTCMRPAEPLESRADTSKPIVGMAFNVGGRGDKSFNDSTASGVDRGKANLGFRTKEVSSRSAADYGSNIEALIEGGADPVIVVGFEMAQALEEVAPKYPSKRFVIIDAQVNAPNVRSILFREEQGAFLGGVLAGLMTETGKVGFVGGQNIAPVERFRIGFTAGVKYSGKAVLLPPKYLNSWVDSGLAKVAAGVLYDSGADIVFHAAGRAGNGVFMAARDKGKYAIGVDSDQDYLQPGVILTSVLKRVDEAVYRTLEDVRRGKFVADTRVYGVKENAVGLSPMKFTKDRVGQQRLQVLQTVMDKMIAGELTVPANQAELDVFKETL